MAQQNKRSGFTLLELLVVLILISLITGIVGPRLIKPLSRRNIESGARQIAASLRYARSEAVSTKVPFRALFDMDADQLTIENCGSREEEDPLNPAVDPDEKPLVYKLAPGIGFEKGFLLSGEIVTDGGFEIMFFPMGGTSGGEVILSDKEDRRFSITVDMITGSVTVQHKDSSNG